MKTKRTSAKAVILFIAIIGVLLLVPCMAAAGQLEPTAPPGPTMKTLDEIPPTWSQKLPAAQRFVLVLDGAAVLDKETGLVWERVPSTSKIDWFYAEYECYSKTVGGRKGWRLPSVAELASLIDPTQSNPKLPSGHPFQIAQDFMCLTSTDYTGLDYGGGPCNECVYTVNFYPSMIPEGIHFVTKSNNTYYHWAVRGGQ